jgi:hypothetical protein
MLATHRTRRALSAVAVLALGCSSPSASAAQSPLLELDHIYIVVPPGAVSSVEALRQAGILVDTGVARHEGQGTASRRLFSRTRISSYSGLIPQLPSTRCTASTRPTSFARPHGVIPVLLRWCRPALTEGHTGRLGNPLSALIRPAGCAQAPPTSCSASPRNHWQ